MHKSGSTIELKAGDYRAQIVTVGAGLASLTHRGRHIVIPHPPEEMPLAHLGKVLIPWPNRIANGRYRFNGEMFSPAVNDSVGNAAIHGLLAWQNWQIVEQSDIQVTLSAFLPPTYGYPFMLAAEMTYRLDDVSGLSACILSENIGDVTAPYGAGVHPYLTCNLQRVDECELELPTNTIFSVAELTQGVDPHLDFLTRRSIGTTQIDHTFRLPEHDAPWTVRLTHSPSAMSVWLRASQPWVQIYTGEKLARKGLATEPMSCPPDAFNSGIDLVLLNPGDTHQLRFSLGGE